MPQKNENGRVIITAARSLMALTSAHSLGKMGVEVIGADCVPVTMLTFSKYVEINEEYTNHEEYEEKFISDLEKIIEKHKPGDDKPYLLMPTFRETEAITKNKERLEKHGIKVASPDWEAISKVHPKDKLALTATELEVHVPKTYRPDEEELKEAGEKTGYPALVKPLDASGGKGIILVENFEDLKEAYRENLEEYGEKPLVQQYVSGVDYCYTSIFQNGELKADMAYKNLQRYPIQSGSGVMRETIDESRFRKVAQDLLGPLKWNGIAQLDFVWDETEEQTPYLIEINPRFWGGLFHSVKSGIDYPRLSYMLYAHGSIPEGSEAIIGTKTKLPAAWLLASIEDSVKLKNILKSLSESGKDFLEEIKQGHFLGAIKSFGDSLNKGIRPNEVIENFVKNIDNAGEADSEILTREDPAAVMGLFYIFVYLFNYGKLPPEV